MPPHAHSILIGLGNPGKKYSLTRHNAGFMALDFFHMQHKNVFSSWKEIKKYSSTISRGMLDDYELTLVKPQTFMNNSGQAVKKLVDNLRLTINNTGGSRPSPTQLPKIIVIYDDIALPLGTIRIRENGSAGGHNGVKSLIHELGTDQFVRVRIGIASDKGGNIPAETFVLTHFTKQERVTLQKNILSKVSEAIAALITKGVSHAQQTYNVVRDG